MGISADKPETQQKFIDKFGLEFPMISDASREVIRSYGAEKVLGVAAERKTFLIGPDGRVAHVWPKVKLDGHAADVVVTLRSLQ